MSNLPQLCYYTSTSYISNIHDDCVVFVSTGWYAEYAYDANGSLTADANKGISSFTWNEIGLPKTVTFSDGSSVSYLYAADGTKLREIRTVSGSSTTLDWCGGLALEQLGSGTRAAKRLRTGAGYVDLSSGVTALRYQVLDHLGSVRAVVGASGTVLESDDYYPLGGPLDISSASVQPEKFQRKEWNTAKAFNTYDFGARLYDPAIGRWLSQDPLAEQYHPHSPYLFCAGNPMKFVDPTGKDNYRFDASGYYIGKEERRGKHQLVVESYDKRGNLSINYYGFADPRNDPAAIDAGIITRLAFISESDIQSYLKSQGTFDPSIKILDFVDASNSLSTNASRSFDYSASVLSNPFGGESINGEIRSKYLFLPEGDKLVHNLMNFGNYLWGASGYTIGLPIPVLLIGAHANSFGLFSPSNRGYNGYRPQFDSRDDQRSISAGAKHAINHSYRNYRK